MNELNPKQLAFCEEYIKDSNGAQSAIRAGYSAKTATVKGAQLLAIVNVKLYIKTLRSKLTSSGILTAVEIQKMLSEKAKEDLDSNGLKALDMLSKMQGNYEIDNAQQQTQIAVQYYAPQKNGDL